MGYIWEDYNKELYYYVPEKQSYYQEVWNRTGNSVPVNLYNRFMDVFYCNENGYKLCRDDNFKDVINIFVHLLSQMDRLRGVTLEDIKMSLIYDEIANGLYGDQILSDISDLEYHDLYIVLKKMVKRSDSKNREYLLDEVLRSLFGKIIIYDDKAEDKIIIYIECIRTPYREKVFRLACNLFADFKLKIRSFWANEHFGIIDQDTTMRIDRLTIY